MRSRASAFTASTFRNVFGLRFFFMPTHLAIAGSAQNCNNYQSKGELWKSAIFLTNEPRKNQPR